MVEGSCKISDKAFSLNASLKRHELTHTEEKPYIYSKCDDTFTQQQSLKTHALTFSGEKQLSCSNCEKAFTQQSIFRET